MRSRHSARGFTLIEVGVMLAITAIAGSVLMVARDATSRSGQVGRSLANLRQLSVAHASYQFDFRNTIATFSWQPGDEDLTPFDDLKDVLRNGSPLSAASAQFTHLMRTVGGDPDFPLLDGFFPYVRFSQIPLLVYLGEELQSDITLSPGDASLRGFRDGTLDPPGTDPFIRRWVFGTSYQIPPTFYAPEGEPASRMFQASHNSYRVSSSQEFRGRSADLIAFPSEKVILHEEWQFYFGPRITYFAMKESRIPLLLADGSAVVRATANANEGWRPNRPTLDAPTFFWYRPNTSWEPPAVPPGTTNNLVIGHYRWTRAGILGRDYGPEVPGF